MGQSRCKNLEVNILAFCICSDNVTAPVPHVGAHITLSSFLVPKALPEIKKLVIRTARTIGKLWLFATTATSRRLEEIVRLLCDVHSSEPPRHQLV